MSDLSQETRVLLHMDRPHALGSEHLGHGCHLHPHHGGHHGHGRRFSGCACSRMCVAVLRAHDTVILHCVVELPVPGPGPWQPHTGPLLFLLLLLVGPRWLLQQPQVLQLHGCACTDGDHHAGSGQSHGQGDADAAHHHGHRYRQHLQLEGHL